MSIPMTLHFKDYWLKIKQYAPKKPQLLATEIYKSKIGMSPDLMNDIFQLVGRPYNLRRNFTLEVKRNYTLYHDPENFSSLSPKQWDLLPNPIKIQCQLRISRPKLALRQLITVLACYGINMLGEQKALFHSFARSQFYPSFARPFANHISSLHTIQLYFLSKPTDCILCNYFESFNFTYSLEDILTDCRDFREFYINFLFGFNQSYFVIIFTTIKFSARREKKCSFGNFKRVCFFRI